MYAQRLGPRDERDWDGRRGFSGEAFTQDLVSSQILVQALVAGMKSERFGRIINIVSTSVKQPIPGLGVSNMVRGAGALLAKTLAGELAPFGITVNNILPGATETARLALIVEAKASSIPLGHFAKPEEIAYAAGFLASDKPPTSPASTCWSTGGRTMSL
jgi:3-oxoacyl-[acyl-carrier protein] reductase